ncbi:MAG: NUDIX domain-containing protein, partial [Flavobacteriales bacterium]
MARKYEVHIDGKLFIIGERPDLRAMSEGWLIIRVDHPDEWPALVRRMVVLPEVRGVHAFGDDVEQVWDWFRAGYRFVQAAGGAVTDVNGRLLAIHRLGRWDLPKGKVERGESIEAAAVREVQEECGISRIELTKFLCSSWHTYERKGLQHLKRTDWFLMRADGNEALKPQIEEEIDTVEWIAPA